MSANERIKGHPAIKVAHITTADASLRYLLLNQLISLQRAGYEVVGISSPKPELTVSSVPIVEAAGIRHLGVPMTRRVSPLVDMVSLWHLYRIMRKEKFTIVHVHTAKAELLGVVAARLAGVPIIIDTFRGIYFRRGMHPFWRRVFILMASIAASSSDLVLSQSHSNLSMAVQEGICRADKIKWLGNGIDMVRFSNQWIDDEVIARKRQDLGLSAEGPVVGFVGRLVADKGIRELLEAGTIVQQTIPDIQLLLVGPLDRSKPDFLTPDVAREYGLQEACVFAGMRDDMPEMYALMDVFVFPSHRESFPRSLMEASAMGVPCVASNIPGCREVIEDGVNGCLVPPFDAQSLAKAILCLLQNREAGRRLAKEGYRIARERFDEQLVFERVKAEYARLLIEKGMNVPSK